MSNPDPETNESVSGVGGKATLKSGNVESMLKTESETSNETRPALSTADIRMSADCESTFQTFQRYVPELASPEAIGVQSAPELSE